MNRSIVMVDWTRNNQPTQRTRDEFLWHQILLSLLYDEVLAQDETILCSKKLSRWFSDSESFRLLEQLVDCGGLTVLKRPWERYPEELQEQERKQSITARREYLEKFGVNNDGTPVRFSNAQRAFHSKLQGLLINRRDAHHYAGSKKLLGKDLMKEFALLLTNVLTDQRYEKWLRRRFKSIKPTIADDFVKYIADPVLAIANLEANDPDRLRKITSQSGEIMFNTALAVQIAATYREASEDLQDLIESVFARPFCEDEGAEGRYGEVLRELPFTMDAGTVREAQLVNAIKVEVVDKVLLRLPPLGSNFAEVIANVRERNGAKKLRKAMNQLGHDTTFTNAINAWHEVSADIASLVSPSQMKEVELQMLLVEAGKGLFWGVVTDFSINPSHNVKEIFSRLVPQVTGTLFEVGGDMCHKLIQADLEQQQISQQLEQAVAFSCVPHPTIRSN